MNQKQFPLVLKLEFHAFSHDAKADFPRSNINSGTCISQEWSPKYERNPKISFHIEDHEVREYEGVPEFYQEIFHDSLKKPHGRVYQLHIDSGRGKCRIAEFFKCYLGHDVDTSSKVTQSIIKVAIKD